MNNFAKNFIRLKGKISIAELSRRSKLSRQLIYNYINGTTQPSIKNIEKFAEIFNCDIKDFFL